MQVQPIKSRIARRIALIVLTSTLFVAAIAIFAGRGTLFQLASLAEDERVVEALNNNQKSLVSMYRARQRLMEPLIEQCLQQEELPCPNISETFQHQILGNGREIGWVSENTFIGIDNQQNRHQFVFDWILLKPQFESVTALLANRLHLTAILPEIANTFLQVFCLALFAALISGLAVSYMLGRRITSRVNALSEYTRTIAAGGLEPAPKATLGSDEIGFLANSMQTMASDLAVAQNKLLVSEKMASWQTVARKVAHEIKNPLLRMSCKSPP
jgi:nitrogen fixation/metabolism regulation signal transduction histidine kinase